MMNIRFNLPEDTVEELDQYVRETMPLGYATSVSNLIKYGLYHQMASDTYEIFIGQPCRILEQELKEDADIRRELVRVFTELPEVHGTVSCYYCASRIPMAVLTLRLSDPVDVRSLIRKVPGLMLPCIVPEQDRSISLMFLPEASDRSNDVYDEMDKAEACMAADPANILTAEV